VNSHHNTNSFWEKVECPTCHSKIGQHCFVFNDAEKYRRCHGDRYKLAVKNGFGSTGTIYLPGRIPKQKKVRKEIGYPNHHPEGWISGNCVSNHHTTCYSKHCSCECHIREQGI